MELSIELPVPDDTLGPFIKEKIDTCPSSVSCQILEEKDIIDTSGISFSDDENWLCECSSKSESDIYQFLYNPNDESASSDSKHLKNIDTRTFTRPKKRFTRPSIEKYNEELYGNGNNNDELKELTDSGIQLNGLSLDEMPAKPLHFELGQPTTSLYFENILANAAMIDSFQNMSPPSLVNSMCSSTFANLMENSYIKNDPVLREIRDTDYTGSVLQQESEPTFHSISESCSSLNSDVPEQFLKKVSFIDKGDEEEATLVLNATFAKDEAENDTVMVNNANDVDADLEEAKKSIYEPLNNTYQRVPKNTKLSDSPVLNHTFQRRKSTKSPAVNATIILESEKVEKTQIFENTKRLLDRRPSPSMDLNRLSYLVDKNDQINTTYTNEATKRNSFGSTDSGENLDYMSLSSGSSKSSKLQSTDGLNIISDIQNQERHFNQIMSTPKSLMKPVNLFRNHEISPIRDRNSDPETSSNVVIKPPLNPITKQRSVGQLNKKLQNAVGQVRKGAIRGSHPNLRMNETRTLQKSSNLNSMGHTLKGSYTSLKPTNPNLPVAPPPLDTTTTVKNPTIVAQVPPSPREAPKSQDAQFVKPQGPRSGLPRPVTGIPRPVSRIPGPRTVVRPISKSAGLQGRH